MDMQVPPSEHAFINRANEALKSGDLHKLSDSQIKTVNLALKALKEKGTIEAELLQTAHSHLVNIPSRPAGRLLALFQEIRRIRPSEKQIHALIEELLPKIPKKEEAPTKREQTEITHWDAFTGESTTEISYRTIKDETSPFTYIHQNDLNMSELNANPSLKALTDEKKDSPLAKKTNLETVEGLIRAGQTDKLEKIPRSETFDKNIDGAFKEVTELGDRILAQLDGKLKKDPEGRTMLFNTYYNLSDLLKNSVAPHLAKDPSLAKQFGALQAQRALLLNQETVLKTRENTLPARALKSTIKTIASLNESAAIWTKYSQS